MLLAETFRIMSLMDEIRRQGGSIFPLKEKNWKLFAPLFAEVDDNGNRTYRIYRLE